MSNTKPSAAGLGIDLYPSDGSCFDSIVGSAGSPPNLTRSSDGLELRPNDAEMHLSCYKDYAGDFLAIPSTKEHLDSGLRQDSLNLRDLSEDTLFSASASIGRNSAELKTILGNVNSRLKSGAILVPALGKDVDAENSTVLEQAKHRARVSLDIALESNVCVQDGYLKGHIKVCIRKHSKKDHPILVSGGKVRVIGFECIMDEDERLAFYQASAPLSEVASGLGHLYVFEPDGEGFCRAIDGTYSFPFALHLPVSSENGTPKGVMRSQSGISVRYIVMVFVLSQPCGFAGTKRSIQLS